MAMFSERHTGYKTGVVLFCIGVVAFVVGFASPYWTVQGDTHMGLWEECHKTIKWDTGSICISLVGDKVPKASWYSAVQALQCLALIGFLLASCYAIHINCCAKSRVFKRYIECFGVLSAVLGFVGTIIFAAEQFETKKRRDDQIKNDDFEPVAWSFAVDIVGCILSFVAAVLVAVFNKPLPADPPSSTFQPMQPGTTVAPGPTYANASPASAPHIVTYTPAIPYNQGPPVAAVGKGRNPPPY